MDIRPSDLIQLKKDIARIRKHEEERRARAPSGETQKTTENEVPTPPKQTKRSPVAVGIRDVIEALLGSPRTSKESLEAIPEYLITVLEVVREEPKFRRWLLQLEAVPLPHRNEQLTRMSHAFRIEDGSSIIAAAFDRLHEPALFTAVCQFLRDKGPSRTGD
jgi:hypothetical protein